MMQKFPFTYGDIYHLVKPFPGIHEALYTSLAPCEPDVVAHRCNFITQEVEAGKSEVQSHLYL